MVAAIRASAVVLLVTVLAGGVAAAGGIVIHAGPSDRLDVPVFIPWSDSGPVVVKDAASGAPLPATQRNGELVVVIPKLGSGQALLLDAAPGQPAAPAVKVEKRANENVIEVSIKGEPFTAYHYPEDEVKPFLWPVLSAGGVHVTRNWPMGEAVEGFRQDHPHHRSLYSAYGDLNGTDCWLEGEKAGWQTAKSVSHGSGDAYGWVRAENVWQTIERKPVVDETREYRFYATAPERRMFDVSITFSAAYGDVTFGDTKEGGLVSVRMRPELSFGNGTITNAYGDQNEKDTWGKPSPWCDYSGPLPEVGTRGVAVFDHPTNLRHPTSWHVRDYGLMGANPFGWSYYVQKDYNKPLHPGNDGSYLLKSGQSLTFNYRIYVHAGDVTESKVAERFHDFAVPPVAVTP